MGKSKILLENSEDSSQSQEGALKNVGVWLFSVVFGIPPVKITFSFLCCAHKEGSVASAIILNSQRLVE